MATEHFRTLPTGERIYGALTDSQRMVYSEDALSRIQECLLRGGTTMDAFAIARDYWDRRFPWDAETRNEQLLPFDKSEALSNNQP